ncbi:hypothetical protein BC830DRAFT_1233129 [Chytriomyces sp. MP71]|nr:hypothetical protein BC830DRAFT_1233129 [Chytriomyces sp. MP71]
MDTYVQVSQAADGRITSTLSLTSSHLDSFTSGSPVQASFAVNALPLCTASGSLPARRTDSCPSEMLTLDSRCFSISCTGPAPVGLTTGLYEVDADFTVGRSTDTASSILMFLKGSSAAASSSSASSTAGSSSSASSSLKATSSSSVSPSPSSSPSSSAKTTGRLASTNGVQSSIVTTTVSSSAASNVQPSDNGSANPVAIGVGASIGAIFLAGIATIVYCNYAGRVRPFVATKGVRDACATQSE